MLVVFEIRQIDQFKSISFAAIDCFVMIGVKQWL